MANAMPYCPVQTAYTASFGEGLIRIALEGGAGRYRRVSQGDTHTVACRWILRGDKYSVFMGFYRNFIRSGGEPFTIPLTLDSANLDLYTAQFIPGTVQVEGKSGEVFTVSGQLEVQQLPLYWNGSEDEWGAIAMLVGEYGSIRAAAEILNLLDKLVNVDLPYYA